MSSRISKLSVVSIDECHAADVERELEDCLQKFGVPLRQTMIGCCTMCSFVPIDHFTPEMDKSVNVPLLNHIPHTSTLKSMINRIQTTFRAWNVKQVRIFKFINAYEFVKVTINRKQVENPTIFDGEVVDELYQDIDLDVEYNYQPYYYRQDLSIIPKAILYYFGTTPRPLDLFKLEDESSIANHTMVNGDCLALFCDKVR